MDFKDFGERIAPAYCGVHPSYGTMVKLVIQAEESGEPAFSMHVFETPADRAIMAAPYGAQAEPNAYKQVIEIIEYAICRHRQAAHGEDYNERIGQLSESLEASDPSFLDGETIEAFTMDWWNN